MLAVVLADPQKEILSPRFIPSVLFAVFIYWQVFPILMAGTGAQLDLRRLRVYPIPQSRLFTLEVLLRLSTGIEMMLILIGTAIGLLVRPGVPFWAPILSIVPFIFFNLYLATGIKEILTRLLARKYFREAAFFIIVLVAALPQVLVSVNPRPWMNTALHVLSSLPFPWRAAGAVAGGSLHPTWVASLAAWTAGAWLFARWRFSRSMSLDMDEARARSTVAPGSRLWLENIFRIPGRIFPDPLGVLIEKEFRFLSRSPRFRLVFLMGFTFGQLIWLPVLMQRGGSPDTTFSSNYLTFVSVYALMLLGEVLFWNAFGFDRAAVQVYYLMPVRFSTVLVGKNIAAVTWVILELLAVTLACLIVRLPLRAAKIFEAFAVTMVFALYLMALGNLGSTHHPRPVNPAQSWRSASAGRFQALLLIVYPLLSIPIMLAYLARYALESEVAFYGSLAFAAVLGAIFYGVAMDSAVSAAERRKEQIVAALSQGEGPVGAT
jgi:ABC-2 type transport system permease protein